MSEHERLRRQVAERDGWTCTYCACDLIEWYDAQDDPRASYDPDGNCAWDERGTGIYLATLDHVDASLRGRARNDLENLALACTSCNAIKGNRGVEFVMARLQESV